MAFNPTSTIYLCNVPIDNTYKHQIYFDDKQKQNQYFSNKVVKTFAEYLTVRKVLPNGGLQSSVKVESNIDDLYKCNYMYYQNENHGTRIFYAFIVDLIYINEGTTEIVFETDVFQTWFFDVDFKESYVVREHSVTDNIGDNIVPENFNFQDFEYHTLYEDTTLDEWGYLVGCSECDFAQSWLEETFGTANINGKAMTGIYQGVYFFYYEDISMLNKFLSLAVEEQDDCILFISVIPSFNLSVTSIDISPEQWGAFLVKGCDKPAEKEIEIPVDTSKYSFGTHKTVKNKKLYTAPFFNIVVTNHNNEEAVYNLEDFTHGDSIKFKIYGDISANPSVVVVPCNYKKLAKNYDESISIKNYPQCSFNIDAYKLWLSKNAVGMGINALTSAGAIFGGAVTGNLVAAGSGIVGITHTLSSMVEASHMANKVHLGKPTNNLLTAMGKNKFDYYIRTIKGEYAETVDNFFTMFGYQTNKLKIPNFSSRPYFNYVQTADCNIVGGIPDNDMRTLKAIFNNGVTLWKSNATVCDYSVNNNP